MNTKVVIMRKTAEFRCRDLLAINSSTTFRKRYPILDPYPMPQTTTPSDIWDLSPLITPFFRHTYIVLHLGNLHFVRTSFACKYEFGVWNDPMITMSFHEWQERERNPAPYGRPQPSHENRGLPDSHMQPNKKHQHNMRPQQRDSRPQPPNQPVIYLHVSSIFLQSYIAIITL